jgi:hypothetical protein
VYARGRRALVHVRGAVLDARETWSAVTEIHVDEVRASATIIAWIRGALVDVLIAVFARPSWRTETSVLVDEVCAFRSVLAWNRCTLVEVNLALEAIPTRSTLACECSDFLHAGTTIHARLRAALVVVHLAVITRVTIHTDALVRERTDETSLARVQAAGGVLAR